MYVFYTFRSQGAADHEGFIDEPELFHGLPVGLQLIGRTWEEEGVIAMAEIVDDALKGHKTKPV